MPFIVTTVTAGSVTATTSNVVSLSVVDGTPPPPPPPPPPAGKPLLTPADFTFLGSYTVADSVGNGLQYGAGLALRRVNGQLRFLTIAYGGGGPGGNYPVEFALPTGAFGQTITSRINAWNNFWAANPPNVGYGLWWEDQGNGNDGVGRCWSNYCIDYPSDANLDRVDALAVRMLNNDGPPSNSSVSGYIGLQGFAGISQRAIYGGACRIPQWWRTKYNVTQPYAVGWGGYTSRMAQGMTPSMGLMVVASPDPFTYAPGAAIPTTDFKILADHRTGATQGAYGPTTGDRGQRNPNVTNQYDNGNWLSPAPDGHGRMVWGDSFYQTGCWIDGPNKQGFLAVLTCAHGNAWYAGSTLHCDSRDAELQIFDPDDFGAVLGGTKNAWNVQPAASKILTADLAPLGLLYGVGGNAPRGGVAAAAVDPATGILWLWCPGVNGNSNSVLAAYQMNW